MANTKKDNIPEELPLEAELVEDAQPEQTDASQADDFETALAAEKDKFLRLAAEYDNYRKRSIKERESIYNDGRADAIIKFLPVYDNLSRALKQDCGNEAFYKGVEMTMTQLSDILDKLGVKEIPAVGEAFNPEMHNAVMHVEDPEYGDAVVIEEFEKGFMLGDKVIRFSMVKVAN